MALLAWLLADPYDQVQQQALLVIGNLCSDSVDPNSAATKQQLLYNGAGRSLLACVFSDDPYMLILACGALQNLCYDRDWATFVVEHGAPRAHIDQPPHLQLRLRLRSPLRPLLAPGLCSLL